MKKKLRKMNAALERFNAMEIPVHSAHASFFLVLSVFPMVVLTLGILRYTGLEVSDLVELVDSVVPSGLIPFIERQLMGAYSHTSRLVISVSAVVALWSAGSGIYALKIGLDAVYGVKDQRFWLFTRLLCAFYMVLFLLVLVMTLVLHVFSNTIVLWLSRSEGLFQRIANLLDMRMFLLEVIQTLVFCAMFMFLPGKRNGFRASLPGALFACFGWLIASHLFSLYMEYFPRYFSIFGSVYSVAVGMLWLYTCVNILFFGALMNRILSAPKDVTES